MKKTAKSKELKRYSEKFQFSLQPELLYATSMACATPRVYTQKKSRKDGIIIEKLFDFLNPERVK